MKKELVLSTIAIDELIKEMEDFLSSSKITKKQIISARLSVEDMLMRYIDNGYEGKTTTLSIRRGFGSVHIQILVDGAPLDPFGDETEDEFLNNLISRYSKAPVWKYEKDKNKVTITLEKEESPYSELIYIFIAIVFGLVLGFIVKANAAETGAIVMEEYLEPVAETILKFLAGAASFMIFASVINGICGMGDLSSFSTTGKKLAGIYLSALIGIMIATVLFCSPFYKIKLYSGEGGAFGQVWELILDIIPGDLVSPFMTGNMIHIIFLAICLGIIMIILGNETDELKHVLHEIELVIGKLVHHICKFVPIVIFVYVYGLVLLGDGEAYKGLYKPLIMSFLICVLYALFAVFRASRYTGMSFLLTVKNLSTAFLVCLSTASSSAGSPEAFKAGKKFGLSEPVLKMGIPLGQVAFMPCTQIYNVVMIMHFATVYNISINPVFLIKMAIAVFLLVMACPPVPGGSCSMYVILYAILGIPAEAVVIMLMLDAFVDHIDTSLTIVSMLSELTRISGRKGASLEN